MKDSVFQGQQLPWWQAAAMVGCGILLAAGVAAADLDIVRSLGQQAPARTAREYLAVVSTARGQCHGHTKAGTTCRAKATLGSLYCRAHDPALPRCGAALHSGSACSARVAVPGERCTRHTVPAGWHAPLALPRKAKP